MNKISTHFAPLQTVVKVGSVTSTAQRNSVENAPQFHTAQRPDYDNPLLIKCLKRPAFFIF